MRKIVVGYDGSEHADRALDRAAALAGEAAAVTVVAAVPVIAHRDGAPLDPVQVADARKALDRARERLDGLGVAMRAVESHGDPAGAIVNEAKEEGAELIVVGTRGLNFTERALLGSVSTKVVHHAPCDVLVVR